jgi:hypothetical protein
VTYQPSLDRGGIVFDPSKAEPCVEALRTMSCAEYGALGPGSEWCESPFVPQLEEGEACEQSTECTTNNCASIGGAEDTCLPIPGEGEECDLMCEPGFDCSFGECVALDPDGTECTAGMACVSRACIEGVCATVCDGQ